MDSENTKSLLLTEKKYGNALLVQFSPTMRYMCNFKMSNNNSPIKRHEHIHKLSRSGTQQNFKQNITYASKNIKKHHMSLSYNNITMSCTSN